MYCPRCGEAQSSGNLRFCNRCGLQLGLISEVVSNDGTLPQLEELNKSGKKWLTRKNGLFFSLLWFLVFILLLVPFWGILDVEELAGMSAILGVFGSLIIMLSSLFFLEKSSKGVSSQQFTQNQNAAPQNLSGQQTQQNALPPQQSQPAQDYVTPPQQGMWKAPDTGELVQPGSVTEGTTKLLSKEEEKEEKTKYFNE